MRDSPAPPTSSTDGKVRAALKEWATVVASLERGETSLILRKGGILEAKRGFQLEHARSFLLPTQWHEREHAGTLDPATFRPPTPVVRSVAEVVDLVSFDAAADLSSLAGLHAYSDAQIAKRRDYRPKLPLHALVARVRPLAEPITLSGAAIEGCRSWVEWADGVEATVAEPLVANGMLDRLAARLRKTKEPFAAGLGTG